MIIQKEKKINKMTLQDINIRDPYILNHEGIYYMYGTRAETCWGKAEGFDCYTSVDLTEWKGPYEIFRRPDGFWADQNFWAPECIYYNKLFYLVTTFGTETRKGVQILVSKSPTGAFIPLTEDVVTPREWTCIDGTIYIEEETPYLVFSHSFEDNPDGEMCMCKLSKDLKKRESEVFTLFNAKEASWAKPVPFAEKEFGIKGDVYFTDGPSVYQKKNGSLIILWSSWGDKEYSVGAAIAESGKLKGPWKHLDTPVFDENGGHGMMFASDKGELFYALHYPNELYHEHPLILRVWDKDNTILLED